MESDLWAGAEVRWSGPAGEYLGVSLRPGDGAVVVDPGRHGLPSFGMLKLGGPEALKRARSGVVIRSSDGSYVEVPREYLELVAPEHLLAPEPDAGLANWFGEQLAASGSAPLTVDSFVPRSFPAIARVLHPWDDGSAREPTLRWAEVAAYGGFGNLRELATTTREHAELEIEGYARNQQSGELDHATARALVEVLHTATTTPDDVLFAVWVGWGDVPAKRFPGAATIETPGREHFLLRGPLQGALTPIDLAGRRPVSGIWWPADHAWFVSSEIDFEWTFVAGSHALIEQLLGDPRLEVTLTHPDAIARLPDEDS